MVKFPYMKEDVCVNLPSNKEAMDNIKIIKELQSEFYAKLDSLKALVPRDAQLPVALGFIKVAIGMRRAGKTFLLYEHIQKLLQLNISRSAILYINFEDDRLFPLDYKKLAGLIEAFYSLYPENHERKCYLFLDEIQNVENWPAVIRRMHDTKNAEIFLTGSSAKLLSKEIATSLRGRSIAKEIWPYSFKEYNLAKKIEINWSIFGQKTLDLFTRAFRNYISEGGFPEVVSLEQSNRQQVLQEYVEIVTYRDIVERHKIRNTSVIKYMVLFLIHNVARPFSVNKFYNDLKTRGYAITKDVLYEYVEHIEDAFLVFFVPLHDPSIRKVQINPHKVYAIDPGLCRALTLDFESDLGRIFENVVYLDLRRAGAKVHYYLTKERWEVDFLATGPRGEQKLFQVAWDVSDPETLEREQRALSAAMKELKVEGELVTLESYLQYGIRFL